MVLEGKWKMDSLFTPTANIENTLVTALRNGEIKLLSENGAAFLKNCIWNHMKYNMKIDEHKILHLSEGSNSDFLLTILQIPHSDQLLMDIGNELHCIAKHLVKNFLVSTPLIIHPIPLEMRVDSNEPFKVLRTITAKRGTPPTIHQSRGELFYKLKGCIHRKDVFLKGDDHDIYEYVDIKEVLAQGFVVVPDELKKELDKQSECLMEFVYSQVGINVFEKVIHLNKHDPMKTVYRKYIFNNGTNEAFFLRLHIGSETIAFLKSDKHVYAEGSKEFTMLQECGVKLTLHENGQNVFNLHRLFGLYIPHEMFCQKIGMETFKGQQETYKELDKKGNTDAVGTSANAAAAHNKHPSKECAICLNEFSDGDNVLNSSCSAKHVFHLNCFHGWITSMHTTCPVCRQDILKMEKVVELA